MLPQMWIGRTAAHNPHVSRCKLHQRVESLRSVGVLFPKQFLGMLSGKQISRCVLECECSKAYLSSPRFFILNVVVFAIGFISNLDGGFQKSWAFPCAKAQRSDVPPF